MLRRAKFKRKVVISTTATLRSERFHNPQVFTALRPPYVLRSTLENLYNPQPCQWTLGLLDTARVSNMTDYEFVKSVKYSPPKP